MNRLKENVYTISAGDMHDKDPWFKRNISER